ncbi:uncharacterized protein LOC135699423 isoform X1 [Ochlerotatus camptorhynchus]|uniref:uncharacterized protein LOC135699423 isoform X1 n=1 Tax=Ochlerotatus camptorhynchus TaxID=644619 RepID=UPI0031E02E8C
MKVLLLVCSFTAAVVTALGEQCPDQTRPHATRCDQYFRCVLLPSKTHVWIPTKCDKGLIYEPQLKTCVLPGDEWECNLSAEVGNESGENVYGINNLPAAIYTGPTVNPVRLTTPLGSIESDVSVTENGGEGFVDGGVGGSNTEEVTDSVAATTIGQQQITNLPTVSGDNEGYYIVLDGDGNNRTTIYHTPAPYEVEETEEFSGDGMIEDARPTIGLNFEGDTEEKHSSSMMTSDENMELSKNDLNLFLADYTLQTSSEAPSHNKKKKHPLPPNGKIHPEHLTAILNQQKKLNRYASQIKRKGDPTGGVGNRSPFSDQPVFTSRPEGSVLFNVPQRIPEESNTKAPFMSEDVIRSIIEISKQMMSNQKPSMEEMYVKPIFIPISVSSAAQDFTRLPEQPSKIMYHHLFPSLSNNSSQFSPKPIGITITNPYTLGHQATIYDNLRNQIMNGSQYYNYQTAMVDSYGSRFPPQQVPNAPPMYPYPPPMAYPVYSQQNYQYPSNQQNFQYPNNQQTYQYPNPYYSLPQVMNRLRNTASYDNDNSQSNENTISDEEDDASAELPEKEEPSTPNEQSSEENDEVLEDTGSKKLISVGGYTLNYNDYKDSILPLLDANPDEVRISVLTCTLGSRQPNKTECTKYYVCNPHNGAFQSFTCPSFTAFNAETRVCDSATYKSCKTVKPTTTTPVPITLSRLTQNAHKTKPNNQDKLNKYVDMITKEAYKILSRNKIPTEYPEEPQNDGMIRITAPTMSSSMLPSLPSITMPTVPSSTKRLQAKPKRKHSKKRTSTKTNRKSVRKSTTTPTTTTTTEAPPKAPKCKKNGKMSDPAEKHNYYVCYKANPKKFIKTKMACPNNLVYCGSTGYCTYAKNCKN